MSVKAPWNDRWEATYEATAACYREHRFGDAARILEAARKAAIADENPQEAASYSGLLASCLTLMSRNEDALFASEEAERLAPNDCQHVLRSVDILLNWLNRPTDALPRITRLAERLGPSDPWRLRALSLLGQATLALGDSEAAVANFKEIAASANMDRLRRAEYAGVYDLGLVCALIRRGLAPVDCRNYLNQVLDVAKANRSSHLVEQLESLLAQIESRP